MKYLSKSIAQAEADAIFGQRLQLKEIRGRCYLIDQGKDKKERIKIAEGKSWLEALDRLQTACIELWCRKHELQLALKPHSVGDHEYVLHGFADKQPALCYKDGSMEYKSAVWSPWATSMHQLALWWREHRGNFKREGEPQDYVPMAA